MTLVIAFLRLFHIGAAFAWFGLGMVLVRFIMPAALDAGESGLRYLKSLYSKTIIARGFSGAAGLTVIAGILLYLTGDVSNSFSNTGRIVLGIGALVGLLAAGHGIMALGRAMQRFTDSLTKYVAENQPIAADGLTILHEQAMKIAVNGRISLVLMSIALIGMGIARYL
jgi:hypothetical protein